MRKILSHPRVVMVIVSGTYVQVIPVKPEWVLNFFARNKEANEDERNDCHSGDCNPIECGDQLER